MYSRTIDLHGMTVAEARRAMLALLKSCPASVREIGITFIRGRFFGCILTGFGLSSFTCSRIFASISLKKSSGVE